MNTEIILDIILVIIFINATALTVIWFGWKLVFVIYLFMYVNNKVTR